MANRIPLVLESGRTQQHQKDDSLLLSTDAASGAAKVMLLATDNIGSTCFEIKVYAAALLNLSLGVSAGAAITTGSQNICIGASAGTALTTGINNTAIGFQAMQDLSGAFNSNTAIGPNTLRELNAASGGGSNNTAIGPSALRDLLTGSNNVAIGTSALIVATGGDSNVAVGQSSLSLLTTGSENVGVGLQAGRSITTGTTNVFVGRLAGNNAAQKVDAVNSIAIGNATWTTADNQAVIGSTSITQTLLRGTVDIVRSTNACRLNVYNTAAADPPGTSYELVGVRWATNVARIGTEAGAGGGTLRDLAFDRGTAEHVLLISGSTVFNEQSADIDFRVEGATATQLLVCDAGLDAVQIGGGTAGDIADFRAVRSTLKNLVSLGATSELTIAAGVITATKSFHRVDTEADAATDDLDTINGGAEGDLLILRAENDARTVVVKDGTGNIQCAGDFSLDNVQDTITLIFDGSAWLELSRSDNGA